MRTVVAIVTTMFLAGCATVPSDKAVLARISDEYGEQTAQCVRQMQYRPLPNRIGVASGVGNIMAAALESSRERTAAEQLCLSDPSAASRPLPWEDNYAPAQSSAAMCHTEAGPMGGYLVCQ
jgi:hypothetical protein